MTGIYGQDWSGFQVAQPATAGLSFAFVKITEGGVGGYVNPHWVTQRDHAKANGLVFGAYHYPHMHNNAHAEADFFASKINVVPGDMLVLDWEGYDAANSGVSRAEQLAYKESYLAYLKSKFPHNPVGMYCNKDYWLNVDTTSHCGDFLWIATAGLPAGQPGIKHPWLFHQYSANTIDHDYCPMASTAALHAWTLSFQPVVKPPVPPVKPPVPPVKPPVPTPPLTTAVLTADLVALVDDLNKVVAAMNSFSTGLATLATQVKKLAAE